MFHFSPEHLGIQDTFCLIITITTNTNDPEDFQTCGNVTCNWTCEKHCFFRSITQTFKNCCLLMVMANARWIRPDLVFQTKNVCRWDYRDRREKNFFIFKFLVSQIE